MRRINLPTTQSIPAVRTIRKFQTDESKQIKELHYNDEQRSMMAFFVNGSVYYYSGVSLFAFGKVISAESVGVAFNEFIKTNTNYRRVR